MQPSLDDSLAILPIYSLQESSRRSRLDMPLCAEVAVRCSAASLASKNAGHPRGVASWRMISLRRRSPENRWHAWRLQKAAQAAFSTSSRARKDQRASKVSTVDIVLNAEKAKGVAYYMAALLWTEQRPGLFSPHRKLQFARFFLSSFKFFRLFAEPLLRPFIDPIELKNFQTVFLPYWIIDAEVRSKVLCEGKKASDLHRKHAFHSILEYM